MHFADIVDETTVVQCNTESLGQNLLPAMTIISQTATLTKLLPSSTITIQSEAVPMPSVSSPMIASQPTPPAITSKTHVATDSDTVSAGATTPHPSLQSFVSVSSPLPQTSSKL